MLYCHGEFTLLRSVHTFQGKLRQGCRALPIPQAAGILQKGAITVHFFYRSGEYAEASATDDAILADHGIVDVSAFVFRGANLSFLRWCPSWTPCNNALFVLAT